LRSLEIRSFHEHCAGRLASGSSADELFPSKSSVFAHPDEVLRDGELSIEGKRALLASWASDAFSIENSPSLRQLGSGIVVRVDDIMEALETLDEPRRDAAFTISRSHARRARKPIARRRNSRPQDDDEPTPPAVGVRIPLAWRELAGARDSTTSALAYRNARETSVGGRSAA